LSEAARPRPAATSAANRVTASKAWLWACGVLPLRRELGIDGRVVQRIELLDTTTKRRHCPREKGAASTVCASRAASTAR
jgi:hypothetical protein